MSPHCSRAVARLLTLVVLGLALLLASAHRAEAEVLKIAAVVPEGTSWMTAMRKGAKEVAERTDGRVQIKFYPGGVMGDAAAVLRKMRIGQLHGGAFTSGGLSEVYPDVELYGMPFLFRSYAEVDHVRSQLDAELRKGLEARGLVALCISEGGFANLMSRAPVRTVGDLGGHKVWSPENDSMSEVAWKIAGVAPIPLPLADVYTGLQTGLVDTVPTSPVAAIAFQWHTALQYLTDVPLSYVVGILVVDKKTVDKLQPADRAVLTEVLGRVSADLDRENRASDAQAREALRKQGIQFVEPAPEELARWRAIAGKAAESLSSQGTYTPQLLQQLEQSLATYRAQELPAGRDR